MRIKANELQQIPSILDTDSILIDTASAGTGRLSFAQAALYFKQGLNPTADEILLSDGKTTVDVALESLAADNKALSRLLGTLDPLSGEGAPTESTAGAIGQKYTDTTTGDLYTCIAVSAGEDGGLSYIWVPGNLGTLAEIREQLHDLSEA